jgi:serine/threonine protein kinase
VAVKKLEIQVAGSSREDLMRQMQQEVATLSKVQHANIVQLMGACHDPPSSSAAAATASPCLVYALMEGGSLEDRLARAPCGSGSPLTAAERILILSDVARGLAYLHSELKVAHLDVKSGNVLLDRGLVGRIGDFGVCKAIKDNHGATATHLHTENVAGTLVYMAPEYKNGEASVKVDTFAFGLVVIEALTGHPVLNPAPEYKNLLLMFEDEMTEPGSLAAHLDSTTSWDQPGALEWVEALREMADRCLVCDAPDMRV